MIFEFDKIIIEEQFQEVENYLFNYNNIYLIKYENFAVNSFDNLNKDFLKEIANKYIVYCIWQGENETSLKPKYIGHSKNKYSRERIRAHLTKKNEKTGAQLDKVKKSLIEKKYFALSYLIIEPGYMRTSLEEWLINKNIGVLEWNKNK